MFQSTHSSSLVRRTLALAVVLGASAALSAQATASGNSASPAVNLSSDSAAAVSSSSYSSSSVDDASSTSSTAAAPLSTVALNTSPFHFNNAFQYGGGRRGAPRYRGGNTNADGSNKWTFEAGVGFTNPIGDTHTYLTDDYAWQVGFGRQWSKKIAALLQFDYDNFNFQGSTLTNQQNLYNYEINLYNTQNGCGTSSSCYIAPISGLDGTSHVWSFTVNPMYTIKSGEGLGAYVVAGFGFYHKTANFTVPAEGEECDIYYGCYTYSANETIDKYTSNAPGVNGGFGLTYKFSRFASERLFAEVRYVFVANQSKAGVTAATATAANASVANEYPANSHQTYYFPVKVGLRF